MRALRAFCVKFRVKTQTTKKKTSISTISCRVPLPPFSNVIGFQAKSRACVFSTAYLPGVAQTHCVAHLRIIHSGLLR